MNTRTKQHLLCTLLLVASTAVAAHGWHGGGWHGGGWHGGGWHGGGWYGGGVVIGVPFGGYYGPSCQAVRVCNRYGRCWIQRECY